jgi:hypothetical protein
MSVGLVSDSLNVPEYVTFELFGRQSGTRIQHVQAFVVLSFSFAQTSRMVHKVVLLVTNVDKIGGKGGHGKVRHFVSCNPTCCSSSVA